MSNFSVENLLRAPHPGKRVGQSAQNRQPLGAIFSHHMQIHVSGPLGAHTASSSSTSASSSGGVNPGHMVPRTYLYNPNLAVANWVNQLPMYTQGGGTANFVEMMDKFFDCMNVNMFTAGKHKRNPLNDPFRPNNFWIKV